MKKAKKRPRGRPIQKGQRLPGAGRPRMTPEEKDDAAEAREILKAAAPEAARRIKELMQSDDERIALQACEAGLDRSGVAKRTELSGPGGEPLQIWTKQSDDELRAIIVSEFGQKEKGAAPIESTDEKPKA